MALRTLEIDLVVNIPSEPLKKGAKLILKHLKIKGGTRSSKI